MPSYFISSDNEMLIYLTVTSILRNDIPDLKYDIYPTNENYFGGVDR